jgi:hypothetical protein
VNLCFVSAPFSFKADLEIADLRTGLFAKNFLAQAMENACMLQRGSQLAIPLVDFRKELVSLIGLGLGTNLFSNRESLADCVERFSTVAALEVKATQVQKTSGRCLAIASLLANAQTFQVQLERLIVPALLLVNDSQIAECSRLSHPAAHAPENLEASVDTFERLAGLSHGLECGTNAYERSSLTHRFGDLGKDGVTPLVVANRLFKIRRLW